MTTWTSFTFIAPLLLSLYFRLWFMAILLMIVTITAILYHRSEETAWYMSDSFFAWVLIASNSGLIYMSNFNEPHTAVAVLLAVSALIVWCKQTGENYERYHSVWHLISVFITIFSILAFTI